MSNDFVTIGGVTEDIVFFTDEVILLDNKDDLLRQKLIAFEYGAKIDIREHGSYFGGGASNTAVNLSKAGFRVSCLAHVGPDDRARRIIDNLKKNKVRTKDVRFAKKYDSGFSFILNNKKDRVIFSYRGANDSLKVGSNHKAVLENSKWTYLTSLPENCLDSLKIIFNFKNKIYWNPGIRQLSGGVDNISFFLKRTDVFMVNKDEALELVKKSKEFCDSGYKFLNNARNLIKILKSFGPAIVILTDGVKGAYFYDGENFYHQAIIRGKQGVDVTGVGDAFGSTVAGSLELFPGDFKKAMFFGVKNTFSVVSMLGAQSGLTDFSKL